MLVLTQDHGFFFLNGHTENTVRVNTCRFLVLHDELLPEYTGKRCLCCFRCQSPSLCGTCWGHIPCQTACPSSSQQPWGQWLSPIHRWAVRLNMVTALAGGWAVGYTQVWLIAELMLRGPVSLGPRFLRVVPAHATAVSPGNLFQVNQKLGAEGPAVGIPAKCLMHSDARSSRAGPGMSLQPPPLPWISHSSPSGGNFLQCERCLHLSMPLSREIPCRSGHCCN